MRLTPRSSLGRVGFALILISSPVFAQREAYIVETSTQAIAEMVRDPHRGVPPALLRKAQGVIIFPNLVRGGFILGARHGRGLVVVRDEAGQWSNPFFITSTGGSFGLQAGVDSSELLLVFRERRTIDRFLLGQNKLTFGVDASIAAGPVGRGVGADTDPQFRADILTYSRTRGLYAGAVINGAVARVDQRANWTFYGHAYTPTEIMSGVDGMTIPASVVRLKRVLDLPARSRPGNPPADPDVPHDEPIIIEPAPTRVPIRYD
jgi:lipid-binding SYLF domain-containing protein